MASSPKTAQVTEAPEHTLAPFLRRVRIRGYKSIAFCDVPLQPLTILVGRNAAGKSNFLDALAFLRDAITLGVAEAVKRRGGWIAITSRTADSPAIDIQIEASYVCGHPVPRIQADKSGNPVTPTPAELPNLKGHRFSARYALQVVGGQNSPPIIRAEWLELTDETTNEKGGFSLQRNIPPLATSRGDRKNGGFVLSDEVDYVHLRGGSAWSIASGQAITTLSPSQRFDLPLLAVIGFQPYLELSEGLRSMGFYNFHPDAIRTYQKSNPGWLLEKDGKNLASVIEALKEIEPESLERVRDYLRLIAEEVESFDVAHYGENETVRFRLRAEGGNTGPAFDAASMSDGTLRALGALMAAFQIRLPLGPSVVGIEEPEAALHPAAMRALVDALDDATQRTQVLLTTHSADLLSGRDVNPGQVLVVRNRGGQTKITPLDPASREIIDKELYSLADLQRMDKLDLDEADLRRQAQLSQEGV